MTISVIVATFGDSYWGRLARRRAVPSVCAQTVQPLELIRHHGATLHDARNEAAAGAHGDWLCFLDADDELHPRYLEAMTAAVRGCHDPTCPCQDGDACHYLDAPEWVASNGRAMPATAGFPRLLVPAVQMIDGHTEHPPRVLNPGRPITEVNRAVIGTVLPRALFEEVGGFRDWPIYEDWDLWLLCLDAGGVLVDVPDAVYRAHSAPGSRNRQPRAVQVETYDAIRAAHGLPVPRSRRRRRAASSSF